MMDIINPTGSEPTAILNDQAVGKAEEERVKQREHHRKLFQKYLDNPDAIDEYSKKNTENEVATKQKRHSTSCVVDRERETLIKHYLKGTVPGKVNASLKHNIKNQKFQLIEVDDKEVLHRTIKNSLTTKKKVNLNEETLPVAIKEDFFDILYNIHSLQHGHVGQNRTYEIVAMRYHHLTRVVSDNFVKRCSICNLNLVQQSQPNLNEELLININLNEKIV